MAEPEADRGYVDEPEEAFGGLEVAGGDAAGVLEFVEAALDEVAQAVEDTVYGHTQLAGLAHRDDRYDVARFHGFANLVRVIAAVGEENGWFRHVVVHDQVEAQIVRCLPRRDVGPHGEARAVDPEVDLGREATSRTAETLSWSPPLAPAA